MTIKSKISLYVSIFFSVFFGLICMFIVKSFSDFRKEEFKYRLSEKAYSTIRLLVEVKEVDNTLLRIIDRNSIHKLYNEKVLIFDSEFNLIYSSLDDSRINWTLEDLKFLKKNKSFFKIEGDNEIFGVFYDSNQKDYYALISATDSYGKRKLNYLISLMLGVYVVFAAGTWFITFYLVKYQLDPLDIFVKRIKEINLLNIQTNLHIKENSKNEIDLISREFNYLMNRINDVYQKQKNFTAHASHELRTPLLRMSVQIENQIKNTQGDEKVFLQGLLRDIDQLTELINSLLILSKVDSNQDKTNETVRLDESFYNSIEKVRKDFPDFKIDFQIENITDLERKIEVKANPQLLEIVFDNLLKNAYYYSDNQSVKVTLFENQGRMAMKFQNSGIILTDMEQTHLFQPFMRGQNASKNKGLGLGLLMVKRILSAFHFDIKYQSEGNLNAFLIEY